MKIEYKLQRFSCISFLFKAPWSYLGSPSFGKLCAKVKPCNQIQIFTPEYMCTCDALDNVHFNYQIKIFTTSNIKSLNNKSFYRILLLLSGDISLKPGPKNNLQHLDSNEWNVFKSKGLHIIHQNFNSFLPEIDELRYIVNSSCYLILIVAVIGISKSKLDESILQLEIQINNYDLLLRDRNRNGLGVACYIRIDKSYIPRQYFPEEIENIFFEIFLPKIPSQLLIAFPK